MTASDPLLVVDACEESVRIVLDVVTTKLLRVNDNPAIRHEDRCPALSYGASTSYPRHPGRQVDDILPLHEHASSVLHNLLAFLVRESHDFPQVCLSPAVGSRWYDLSQFHACARSSGGLPVVGRL